MKSLFVRAPFAGWIVDGIKKIEYRSRATAIRGKVGIIQSRSGNVIGETEITDCRWNSELELFEWQLANSLRYAEPVPFQHKSGAVVWIDIPYDPEKQLAAPPLSSAEMMYQKKAYQAAIKEFLQPLPPKDIIRFWAVMRDGQEIPFENEKSFKKFIVAHRKEIADTQIEVREK